MANLGHAIYSILTSDATVAALVGTRVNPVTRGQGDVVPAIAYANVGGDDAHRHEAAPSQATRRIQVDSFGVDASQAEDLGQAVRRALQYATGTHGGFTIQRCRTEGGPSDDFNSATRVFRVIQDFVFVYEEGQ